MFRIDEYCIDGEVWKEIPTYEGLYEASDLGRIRSVDGKKTFTKHHGVRTWKGKVLKNKTKEMRKEGFKVTLWKDGESKDWLVARLVCMAFHGNVDHNLPVKEKMTVNHKDGKRANNKPSNIEWLSIQDNIKHAHDTGLMDSCKKQIIIDLGNGYCKKFNSLAEGSKFLGKNKGYLHDCIKKKKNMYDSNKNKVELINF